MFQRDYTLNSLNMVHIPVPRLLRVGHMPDTLCFRPFDLPQLAALLERWMRFKPPAHYREKQMLPHLFKQLIEQDDASSKWMRHTLSQWPIPSVHPLFYTLVHASTSIIGKGFLEPESAVFDGFDVLLLAASNRQLEQNHMLAEWCASARACEALSTYHPEAMTTLEQLHRILKPTLDSVPHTLMDAQLNFGMCPTWSRVLALLNQTPLRHNPQHAMLAVAQQLFKHYSETPKLFGTPATLETPDTIREYTDDYLSIFLATDRSPAWPVQEVVLVEGITEEILLPHLLKASHSLSQQLVIATGGKTVMAKHYANIRPWFNGRLRMVLDADAVDLVPMLEQSLNADDTLYLIPEGSIEDCYPLALFLEAVNRVREGYPVIAEEDYHRWCRMKEVSRLSRSEIYQKFWLSLDMGSYDKAFLANTITRIFSEKQQSMSKGLRSLLDHLNGSEE